MDQRGWHQEKKGWWCCRGAWSSFKFQFTEFGQDVLSIHSGDNFELQPLDVLQYATGIRILQDVSENGPITELVEFLQNANNPIPLLERLEIFRNKMHKTVCKTVLDAMMSSKLSRLSSLTLRANSFDNEGVENLARVIESGSLPSLKHLILGDDEIGSGHLALARAMESNQMHALETLTLYHTGMEDTECEAYETALRSGKLRSLREMSFASNNIGSRGAQALGRAIQSGELKNLVALNLSDNLITDDGLIALAKSFQVGVGRILPNLAYLHLTNNPFTEVGLSTLGLALKSGHLNSLEVLDVSFSQNPNEKGAYALVCALHCNRSLTVHMVFEWYMFPNLDRLRVQVARRNCRNVDILAGLGGSPVVPAAFCKVYLCGNLNVGKTTLRRTLQRSLWESLWTCETRPRVEKRTRGIDVSEFSCRGNKEGENPLTLLIWDMAGQEDYHLIHNAFLPDLGSTEGQATTFVVVCTSKDLEKSVQELEYWLRFIASSCDKTVGNLRHVFIVMNNIGGDPKAFRNATRWKQVLEYEREKFASFLDIQTEVFIVDVRRRRFVKHLKTCLIEHSRNLFKDEEIPEICQFIQRNLRTWSETRKHFPVLHWTEFVSKVHSSRQRWSERTLEAAAKYLNEGGVLIYIDKEFPLDWGVPYRRLVVLDPNWFCREIVGSMFLPQVMVTPAEHPFRLQVDKSTGSISIVEFKKYFKSLLGEWTNPEFEDLIAILLWLGLCYQGRDKTVFMPALIVENETHGDGWGVQNSHEHGEDQWVMGFSVEYKKSEMTLAPIALWHRFQVELAQTARFNGQVLDNDFVIGRYFIAFKVDYMNVLIEVNANPSIPTFDEITILVKPLLKVDHLHGDQRKQYQVDLANDLVETLLRLWNEVCPGVEYLYKVIWPWLACQPRPAVLPQRNVEVEEIKKRVQEHGMGRIMQWEVGYGSTITEDQLLSRKDKNYVVESVQGSLHILKQGMREAVELGIFPPDLLNEEVYSDGSTEAASETEVASQPLSRTEKLVSNSMWGIRRDLNKLDRLQDLAKRNLMVSFEARNDLRRVLKKQKELLHKLQDTGEIFLQDRDRASPRFIYLGKKNAGAWMTLKEASSTSMMVHLHFACEARYNDYRQHPVKDQQGVDVSPIEGWAETIAPWLKVSLAVLFISAKVAANAMSPDAGLVLPDFGQWQQTSSLTEGIALATGFSKEELHKHMVKGMGLGALDMNWNSRELYGQSREAMSELLGSLTPQAYQEKLGLRKVRLYHDDGSFHEIVWICNSCYDKYRRYNISTEKVIEL